MRYAVNLTVAVLLAAGVASAQDRVERSVKVPSNTPPRVAQAAPSDPIAEPLAGPHFDEDFEYEYQYDYDEQCGLNCRRCGGVGCDLMWFRAEYLMYWARGMHVPALATTSPAGTPVDNAGVLGQPGTTVLYGNEGILDQLRNGGRFTAGGWLDCCKRTGWEVDYFFLGEINDRFQAQGFGNPIIMRPFFNALTNLEDAEIVSYPGELGGSITIDSRSFVQGVGARLLFNLLQNTYCPDDGCGHYTCGAARTRMDFLVGYRYMNLDEGLFINEDLISLDPSPPGAFDVNDIFATDNDFHGGELGLKWVLNRNRWEMSLLAKVALGNNHQQVRIRGFTTITEGTNPPTPPQPGGLLAQTSNIGDYSRDEFSTISEFGATLKYQAAKRLWLTAGYTLILWNDVVRPGDQIDRRVNENFIPPPDLDADPFGPNLPAFAFNDTSFWLQGLRLGIEYRW